MIKLFKQPPLSWVHYVVLNIIGDATISGAEIREQLREVDHETSLPSFYTMMRGLEDKGLVHGFYEPITVKGHVVRERRYTSTRAGREAVAATLECYLGMAKRRGRLANGF